MLKKIFNLLFSKNKINILLTICLCLGQRLCRLDSTHTLGKGTYKRQDYIYSSLAGIVNVDNTNNKVIKSLLNSTKK